MINSYLSNKISTFQAVGFLSVMLHHCGYRDLLPATNIYIGCVSNYSLWAISMYFMLSGYLFFQGIEYDNVFSEIKRKYLHRCKSLLIPLILWSFIGSALYYVLYRIGLHDEWTLMGHELLQGGFLNILLHPGVLQMWFIMDLICCFILAIPLWLFIKIFHLFFVFVLLFVSYFYTTLSYGPLSMLSSSLFYFSIGAWLSINKCNIDTRSWPSFIGITLACFAYLFFVLQSFSLFHNDFLIIPFNVVFFIALWLIYDHYPILFTSLDSHFSLRQTQFFMFATFEPFYSIMHFITISFCGRYFEESSIVQIIVLSSIYIFVFVVINKFAKVVKSIAPKTYSVLTGGRT